jgi:hypothetical protein
MNFGQDGQFGPGRLKRPDLNRSRYSIFGATAEAPLFVYPAKLVYATYEWLEFLIPQTGKIIAKQKQTPSLL